MMEQVPISPSRLRQAHQEQLPWQLPQMTQQGSLMRAAQRVSNLICMLHFELISLHSSQFQLLQHCILLGS